MDSYWSWILTGVGLAGFWLAGRKVWWCWYVNIANQVLWFTYAWLTEQWGFILGTFAYSFVFIKNAYAWTTEHLEEKRRERSPSLRLQEVGHDIADEWAKKWGEMAKARGKITNTYEDEDGFHVDFRLDPDPEVNHIYYMNSQNAVCESPDEEDFVMVDYDSVRPSRSCTLCISTLRKKNTPF